jgi:hypothetical protein
MLKNTHLNISVSIIVLVGLCLLTSCATIFNGHGRFVKVYTNKPTVLIYNADTLKTQNNQAFLYAERQKKPLEFIVVTDTGAKKVVQNSTLSFAYIANALFYVSIPGLLIDLTTTKRYGYPNIHLNEKDTIERRNPLNREITINKKGDFLFRFSIPFRNDFYMTPRGEETTTITGPGGLSAGVDYFHSDKQYFGFTVTTALDGVHLDRVGPYEELRTRYFTLSNNYMIGQFSLGYGIAYAHNTWRYYNSRGVAYFNSREITTSEGRRSEVKSLNSLGVTIPVYFNVIAGLNLGFVYRPTFIRFNTPDRYKYEHLLSFDVAYKIQINSKLFERSASGHPQPWQR